MAMTKNNITHEWKSDREADSIVWRWMKVKGDSNTHPFFGSTTAKANLCGVSAHTEWNEYAHWHRFCGYRPLFIELYSVLSIFFVCRFYSAIPTASLFSYESDCPFFWQPYVNIIVVVAFIAHKINGLYKICLMNEIFCWPTQSQWSFFFQSKTIELHHFFFINKFA